MPRLEMTKRAFLVASVPVLIAVSLVTAGLASDGLRRQKDARKNSKIAASSRAVEAKDIPQPEAEKRRPDGTRALVVRPRTAVPSRLRAVHQELADLMTKAKLPAPARRLQQFEWLDAPQFRLQGWHGTVDASERTPDGYRVTVTVTPLVSSSLGASTTILNGVRELYEVNAEGVVSFLESLDPVDAVEPSFITD